MSQRVMDEVGRFAWSVLGALSLAMMLLPACVAVAHGQPVDVPPEEVAFDLAGIVMLAFGLSIATEAIRAFVPQWRRGVQANPAALAAVDAARVLGLQGDHLEVLRRLAVATGGPGELAKALLRVVPVALGLGAAFVGWAPSVGDGSSPETFGGVLSGLVASQFGGQLMSAFRSRLPGAGAQRAGGDDESQP
jgi:hypothetical protein